MSKTILLADDSVTIQKVVAITFANEDVELITADDGDEALIRAREVKPDVILADVSMPGLDGYELCAAIRAEPELAKIPVLLLTGAFKTFDESRANAVGVSAYIAKPFEAQALVDQVQIIDHVAGFTDVAADKYGVRASSRHAVQKGTGRLDFEEV